ncbi:MAG: carbon-nitrogen hydrolase family protein [Myxococcales bacterium]|nr:carbon-nitrogen hydrolase family protein [Myxococcales bacterium]
MLVGVVQMTSTGDAEGNVETALRLVERAVDQGARLVVLPECVTYLGPEEGKLELAETVPEPGSDTSPGPLLAPFLDLARKRDTELVLGGFWERGEDPNHVRNACIHVGANGKVQSVYRKIHLFDVDLADGTNLRESDTVEPGKDLVVTDTRAGKLGLSVCYDLRFPELYRGLVDRGAELLAVPAAFTLMTGKDHWHVLLRARAIESQCYVLAAAQFGNHYGRRVSYGHALIADPWGTVLAECGEGEGVAVAPIDLAFLRKTRAGLPSLAHRRL